MSEINTFKRIPFQTPFSNEKEQAKAYRELFSSELGQKVLDSFLLDVDYHKPDMPKGTDVGCQLAFNAGKRYIVNHILHALAARYEEGADDNDYYGLKED